MSNSERQGRNGHLRGAQAQINDHPNNVHGDRAGVARGPRPGKPAEAILENVGEAVRHPRDVGTVGEEGAEGMNRPMRPTITCPTDTTTTSTTADGVAPHVPTLLVRHLRHLADQIEAGTDPAEVFRDSAVEGPVPPNVIRFNGRDELVEPVPFKLFQYLWQRRHRQPVQECVAEEAVWDLSAAGQSLKVPAHKCNVALTALGDPRRVKRKHGQIWLAERFPTISNRSETRAG